jgi:prolyl oligopeptidase
MRTATPTLRFAAQLLTVAGTLMASGVAGAMEVPPPAPIRPVTDTYYGTQVTDNYRYLENLDDPAVQAWMKSQAQFTETVLASLPGRQPLLKRIHEVLNADLTRNSFVRRGQRYFYETVEPEAPLPKLQYRDGLKGAEHLLLDPAKLGKGTNTHYALDFYMPSWDGRLVAVGISAGGSEDSVIHVIDVKSGKTLGESIDRSSNSVVTWRADNRSFYYLRYAKLTPGISATDTLYNGRTFLHTMGARLTGDGDPTIFGRGVDPSIDVPEGQGTYIVLSPDATYALAVANHNMDQSPSTLFAASLTQATDSHTPWRQIAAVDDGVTQFEVQGDKLYFLTLKGAPRFSLKVTSLSQPDVAHADVVVPEGEGIIDGFALAREGIYVQERNGAGSRLLLVSYDGKQSRSVALPFEGRLDSPVTDPRESGVLYTLQGWVEPARKFAYDAAADKSTDSGLIPPTHLDLSQAESKEVFAVSQDGTRIPLSIIYKKGLKLDGSHPTMLAGYGGYGLSFDPSWFPAALSLPWIERGGVVAIAHIRGGGEYGEAWHRAGQKSTKLNTVFDFIACGDYLVEQHYTSPKLLAAWSASAGGITVGGALTWRPDLFGVIIDQVGMTDSLRYETTPNGPPNISEFGSVKTEDGFHDLYAMGAYLHIRDGTAYPAVLFATGANDPRVAPWEVTKMAARVQAATASGRPALLRIDYDAGHGMGSTEEQFEREWADYLSFILWQTGDPQFQPAQ